MKRKPRNYWTKDKCQIESLKYDTINNFKRGNNAAYSASYRNNWINDICSHMTSKQKPTGYWTYERCKEESLKYKTITELQNNCSTAYKIIRENKWNELCLHMVSSQKPKGYWTYERCKEEALKYNNKSLFQKECVQAYYKSLKNNWLGDICSHMKNPQKPKGYWTYERCKEEALKYKNRYDFNRNSMGAYNRAIKSKWLDDICSHMKVQKNNTKRCIYSYEFKDNHVYIGLTYNLEKRHIDRLKSKNDQVTKHINETNLKPVKKQLTDYIDVNDAIKMEGYYVNKYKNDGWNILNKIKTGAIGGKLKWTYEKCKEESLKYKNRTDFFKKSKGAYASSSKNRWLDEFFPNMI